MLTGMMNSLPLGCIFIIVFVVIVVVVRVVVVVVVAVVTVDVVACGRSRCTHIYVCLKFRRTVLRQISGRASCVLRQMASR